MVVKTELRSAYILLKCSKKSHDDCRDIRDTLLRMHPIIRRAMTTNSIINNKQWCVSATALVSTKDAKQFENKLRSITCTTGTKTVKIKDIHFILDDGT